MKVTERVKRMLLWSFNSSGAPDHEMFLIILRKEGYAKMDCKEVVTLMNEMETRVRD